MSKGVNDAMSMPRATDPDEAVTAEPLVELEMRSAAVS
jgi:hypothetical protein